MRYPLRYATIFGDGDGTRTHISLIKSQVHTPVLLRHHYVFLSFLSDFIQPLSYLFLLAEEAGLEPAIHGPKPCVRTSFTTPQKIFLLGVRRGT